MARIVPFRHPLCNTSPSPPSRAITDGLRGLLRQSVRSFVGDQTGLIGLVILTFSEEPRRVLVMTFWRTEELAGRGSWYEIPMVRESLSPLIASWSRIPF